MARFIFPLQNILNMKEKLEEQAKNDYSRANMRLQEAEEELQVLVNRKKEAEGILKEKMLATLNVEEIRMRENNIEILKMYIRQQMLVIKQREKEVEVAREHLNEAMKERKTYEKLREKAFDKFKVEENKKEQKEIDELVSYRYGTGMNLQ